MNKNLLIPVSKELQSQAALILKNTGLALLKPRLYNYNAAKAEAEGVAYEPGDGSNNYDHIGMLGLPVFDTVKLVSPNFKDNAGNQNDSKEFVLDIALLTVTSTRNIVSTQIAGRNGSIKEYMSDGDYDIIIKGVLVSELATITPFKLMDGLNFMATCPESLHVESNFLSYLNIFELVIKEIKFTQKESTRNVVDYEIKCISDIPFELKNA